MCRVLLQREGDSKQMYYLYRSIRNVESVDSWQHTRTTYDITVLQMCNAFQYSSSPSARMYLMLSRVSSFYLSRLHNHVIT
jgi:hypothetical protein